MFSVTSRFSSKVVNINVNLAENQVRHGIRRVDFIMTFLPVFSGLVFS